MSEIIDIFDISYDGSGVGKLSDGRIVFVPKCLPNEKVCIDLSEVHSKHCLAKCKAVLKKSENRVEVKCPYFEICGGCDYQHVSAQYERELKIQILKRELAKVGYCGPVQFTSSLHRYFYRNKLKLEVKDCQIGYFQAKTHKFFKVKTCPIADRKILEVFPSVELFLKENNFQEIKNVYLKVVQNKVAICFLFDKNAKIDKKNIKKLQILYDFEVFFAFGDILESDKTKIISVFGDKNPAYVQAFNQVNDYVAKLLYQDILSIAKEKRVVNAYSGQGELTKLLSKDAKYVIGIELQKSAHNSAEKICVKEKNIKNYCGRVEEILPEIVKEQQFDMIVLDPAREGCKKNVLDTICQCNIKEIVYVSCNFASLVRDLKFLNDKYIIEEVKIFDMFPCTANMETEVRLRKK